MLDISGGGLVVRQKIDAENCRYAVFHPTKEYEIMAISTYRGLIYFYDLEGNLIETIDARRGNPAINSHYCTYNYDGSKLLFINLQYACIDMFDRVSGDLLHSFSHSFDPSQPPVAVNHGSFFHRTIEDGLDEDYVITSGSENILRRWNVADGLPSIEPNTFIEHTQVVNTGVFDAGG